MTNKTEHEKLKEICDKIGYENKEYYFSNWYYRQDVDWVDAREIIFTIEFMDMFWEYICEDVDSEEKSLEVFEKLERIIYHLDNPVEYLLKLITND